MTTVRFGAPIGGRRTVNFPFDRDVIELIKTIPAHARSWNQTGKHWTVATNYAQELADLLTAEGHTVVGLKTGGPGPVPPPRSDTWAQALFKAVGPDRAAAVHRALTKVLHPDTPSGDTRLQQQLNDAAP